MVDLTAPPVRTCEVEKLKDAVFIVSFKLHTVEVTRDMFLMRTRKALQEIAVIRDGLVIEAFCKALCDVVVSCCMGGLGRIVDQKTVVFLLRRVAGKIAIVARDIEREL
jgi:hypothetical protein